MLSLRTNINQQLQILPILIQGFKNDMRAGHLEQTDKGLRAIDSLQLDNRILGFSNEEFDTELDQVKYSIFDYNDTQEESRNTYYLFEDYLSMIRSLFLAKKGTKEPNTILRKPGRVASPGLEAWEKIGFNNLKANSGTIDYFDIYE